MMRQRRVPPWALLAVVCVGQFMVVLDLSIVNVALPSIQREFGLSTASVQWVVNAYALAFGGFLLLGGRAADLYGRKRVFLVGLAMFAGASLVCALAPNQATLLMARALQGLGGAVLAPATLSILTTSFTDPRERARALGVWSAMAAAGGASGALLGGILTDLLSWRWIFLINLPIAAATFVAAQVVLPESKAEQRPTLDVLGAVTVTGGLTALVAAVALTDTHPWGSSLVLGLLATSAVLFALFAVVETRPQRQPLVPFRLFRARSVTGANLAMFMLGGAMFSMWLFLSLYLQDVLGLSPLITGLAFLPQTLAIVIGAQITSRLVPRLGARPLIFVGSLFAAGGLAWLTQIAPGQTYWQVAFGGGTMATFGMGLAMTPLAFAATFAVAPADAGLASGVLNTSRQVGGSIALAALATLAASHTKALLATHTGVSDALVGGFTRAFAVASLIALAGAGFSLLVPARGGVPAPVPASAPDLDRLALDAET